MTREELIEWGRKEDKIRKSDLESVHSQASLKIVQDVTKKRRKAVGLSAGDAVLAVTLAQKAERLGLTNEQFAKWA